MFLLYCSVLDKRETAFKHHQKHEVSPYAFPYLVWACFNIVVVVVVVVVVVDVVMVVVVVGVVIVVVLIV